MITCKQCGEGYLPGTLFCSECGLFLLEYATEPTMPLTSLPESNQLKLTRPLTANLNHGAVATRLTFLIPSSGRQLTVDINIPVQIGRIDPAQNIRPQLDLTEDRGCELGVSRQHATILSSERGVTLIDLDSTNGTRLNSRRLAPQAAYSLHDGDEIEFGQLLVHVFFDSQ